MIRNIIEYLRKKQEIPIIDFIIEVCSESMYYKYIAGDKNLSKEREIQLKDRLGADELTEEEVAEYKTELENIIDKMMKYSYTAEELTQTMIELEDVENQLLLCDQLVIDYLIIKMTKYFAPIYTKEYNEHLKLLESMQFYMDDFQLIHYHIYRVLSSLLTVEEKEREINQTLDIIYRFRNKTNFGQFYHNLALAALNNRKSILAYELIELAKDRYKIDVNIYGLIKAINVESYLLMEMDKIQEAILQLEENLERAKLAKCNYELGGILVNLMACYSFQTSKKNMLSKYEELKQLIALNPEYMQYEKKIPIVLICLISEECSEESAKFIEWLYTSYAYALDDLTKLIIKYVQTTNQDERIQLLEREILPVVEKNFSVTFYRFFLEEVASYYETKRMYKKACKYRTAYLNALRAYHASK